MRHSRSLALARAPPCPRPLRGADSTKRSISPDACIRAHGGHRLRDGILGDMRSLAPALAAFAILVGACSGGSGPPTQGAGASNEAWRTLGLRDVVSGEEFRISDLRGKVVVIEAMAIWCINCLLQQGEAQAALEQVASPDVVYISLDVDPNDVKRTLRGTLGARVSRGASSLRRPRSHDRSRRHSATRSCRRRRPRSSSSGPTEPRSRSTSGSRASTTWRPC